MNRGTQLRAVFESPDVAVSPGVHDPLSARVADQFSFPLMSITGNGTSLSKPGLPDVGLITMSEMVENATNVQQAVDVPVLADADNGFGNALNTRRTVREFVRSGVGGVHIEDQVFPKRCGFVEHKQVVSRAEAVGKFEAAADVRDDLDPEFVIVARTDARGAEGGSLAEAIDRANAYCEAGADAAFVHGAETVEEVERVGEAVDAPLVTICAASTPPLSTDELAALGYSVVMVPRLSTLATIVGVHESLTALEGDGLDSYADLQGAFDDLSVGSFDAFAGVEEMIDLEARFVPDPTED